LLGGLCNDSGVLSFASHCGVQCSVSGQSLWGLWWKKWHWCMFCLWVLQSSPSSIPPIHHTLLYLHVFPSRRKKVRSLQTSQKTVLFQTFGAHWIGSYLPFFSSRLWKLLFSQQVTVSWSFVAWIGVWYINRAKTGNVIRTAGEELRNASVWSDGERNYWVERCEVQMFSLALG